MAKKKIGFGFGEKKGERDRTRKRNNGKVQQTGSGQIESGFLSQIEFHVSTLTLRKNVKSFLRAKSKRTTLAKKKRKKRSFEF